MNNSSLIKNSDSEIMNSLELNEEERAREVLSWLVSGIIPLLEKSEEYIQDNARDQLAKFNMDFDLMSDDDKELHTALLRVDMQRIRNSLNRTSDYLDGYQLQDYDYDGQGPCFLVDTAISATTSILKNLSIEDTQIPTYENLLRALKSTKVYLTKGEDESTN